MTKQPNPDGAMRLVALVVLATAAAVLVAGLWLGGVL